MENKFPTLIVDYNNIVSNSCPETDKPWLTIQPLVTGHLAATA